MCGDALWMRLYSKFIGMRLEEIIRNKLASIIRKICQGK